MKEKILFLLFAENRKVTIIGDSKAKHLSGIHGVILQIFSGRTIQGFLLNYTILRLNLNHMIMLSFMPGQMTLEIDTHLEK